MNPRQMFVWIAGFPWAIVLFSSAVLLCHQTIEFGIEKFDIWFQLFFLFKDLLVCEGVVVDWGLNAGIDWAYVRKSVLIVVIYILL